MADKDKGFALRTETEVPDDQTYCPLHMHYMSSYLDGAMDYRDVVHIKRKGCKAIAITDHGNLSGTYEFTKECRKVGAKPIIGIESYFAQDRKLKAKDDLGAARPSYHMLMFALNNSGLKNLNRINSVSWQDGFYFSPRADSELVGRYCKDIAATSACLGSITSQYILAGNLEKANYWMAYFKELFNGNFFIELQGHDMEDQRIVNRELLKMSKTLDIPIIVTGDSHYLDCCDVQLHDHLLALGMNKRLDDPDRMRFTWDASVPSYSEMVQRSALYDIPEEAVSNTRYVASLVTDDYFCDRKNRWPSFKKLPPEFSTTLEYMGFLCMENYKKLYKDEPTEEHRERVIEEMQTLKIMGYVDYMLILWDILQFTKTKQILVGMGRGSVGGSFVAYLLGITQVDPFKHGLMFSRFCNEGRAATPLIFDDI